MPIEDGNTLMQRIECLRLEILSDLSAANSKCKQALKQSNARFYKKSEGKLQNYACFISKTTTGTVGILIVALVGK